MNYYKTYNLLYLLACGFYKINKLEKATEKKTFNLQIDQINSKYIVSNKNKFLVSGNNMLLCSFIYIIGANNVLVISKGIYLNGIYNLL